MSNVRWCDIGNHAFPEGQYGATTFEIKKNVRNQWGGTQPSNHVQDACAACAFDAGIADVTLERSDEEEMNTARRIQARSGMPPPPRKVTPAAIAGTGQVAVDKEEYEHYLAYLEKQADGESGNG